MKTDLKYEKSCSKANIKPLSSTVKYPFVGKVLAQQSIWTFRKVALSLLNDFPLCLWVSGLHRSEIVILIGIKKLQIKIKLFLNFLLFKIYLYNLYSSLSKKKQPNMCTFLNGIFLLPLYVENCLTFLIFGVHLDKVSVSNYFPLMVYYYHYHM